MADYGASVSQKGYDVKTCADRFLVYSSAWKNLKIFTAVEVSATIPASGTNTITINHNLGYYAPFFVIYTGSSTVGRANSYFFTDSFGYSLDYFGDTIRQSANTLVIDVDSTFDDATPGATVYFTVYIFLDDFASISAKNVNTDTASGASSNDYGLRISKDGFDVKTCADIDCVLSSSFFNQIIHMSGATTGDTVTHSLGYYPNFFTFSRYSGIGETFIYYETYPWATSSIIDFTGMGADYTKYYLIFKDKLN